VHTYTTSQQLADFRHSLRCFQVVKEEAKYRSCTDQKFRVLIFRRSPYPIALQSGVVTSVAAAFQCGADSLLCELMGRKLVAVDLRFRVDLETRTVITMRSTACRVDVADQI
jgi:hypothetical protein